MHLISVYCWKCGQTSKEHAFEPEHVDHTARRCLEPKYDEKLKKWDRCGGKVAITVKYESKNGLTWPKLKGIA